MKTTPPQAHRTHTDGYRSVSRDVTELTYDQDRYDAADLTETLTALQDLRRQLWQVAGGTATHPNTATWANNEARRITALIDVHRDQYDTMYTPSLARRNGLEETLLAERGI